MRRYAKLEYVRVRLRAGLINMVNSQPRDTKREEIPRRGTGEKENHFRFEACGFNKRLNANQKVERPDLKLLLASVTRETVQEAGSGDEFGPKKTAAGVFALEM